jgi:hypothetical protein
MVNILKFLANSHLVGDPADRIEMIIAALKAFVKIAGLQHSSQREDIRAVAIFLYSGVLPIHA